MKKRSFLLLLYCTVLCTLYAKTFTIEGFIQDANDSMCVEISYLQKFNDIIVIRDSGTLPVIQGCFSFEGEVDEISSAVIKINGNSLRFYIEPQPIRLRISGKKFDCIQLEGTSVDEELSSLTDYLKDNNNLLFKKYNALNGSLGKSDSYNHEEHTQAEEERIHLLLEFCNAHKGYRIVPDLLYQVILLSQNYATDIRKIEELFNAIPIENRLTELGLFLENEIHQVKLATLMDYSHKCSVSPDIIGEDIRGNYFRLYDNFDDKYILLVFWASWASKHCDSDFSLLEENVSQDISIIYISFDYDQADLEKTSRNLSIRHSLLKMTQKYDLYSLRHVHPSSIFSIDIIPTYILLSPKGIILKKWEKRIDWKEMNHELYSNDKRLAAD